LGRVLIAYLDPAEVNNFLLKGEREGQMQQYTNNTLINMELLIKELHNIREQGYAIETE